MNKIMQVEKSIEKCVVSGYKRIAGGVVAGYQKIEDGAVSGYKKIEKKFVDAFLAPDSDSPETQSYGQKQTVKMERSE